MVPDQAEAYRKAVAQLRSNVASSSSTRPGMHSEAIDGMPTSPSRHRTALTLCMPPDTSHCCFCYQPPLLKLTLHVQG